MYCLTHRKFQTKKKKERKSNLLSNNNNNNDYNYYYHSYYYYNVRKYLTHKTINNSNFYSGLQNAYKTDPF